MSRKVAPILVQHLRHALSSDSAETETLRFAVFLTYPNSERRESCGTASRTVQPASRCNSRTLPSSFLTKAPLVRISLPYSTIKSVGYWPRGSTLRYRPRLRFLPVIADILPTDPFQAYFILEALMGFALQGVPLENQAEHSSRSTSPHAVPVKVATCTIRSLPRRRAIGAGRLQGVARFSSPFTSPGRVSAPARPFPSWASSSLGACHSQTMGNLRSHLPCTFTTRTPERGRTAMCYGVCLACGGCLLSRGNTPLPRFFAAALHRC